MDGPWLIGLDSLCSPRPPPALKSFVFCIPTHIMELCLNQVSIWTKRGISETHIKSDRT